MILTVPFQFGMSYDCMIKGGAEIPSPCNRCHVLKDPLTSVSYNRRHHSAEKTTGAQWQTDTLELEKQKPQP